MYQFLKRMRVNVHLYFGLIFFFKYQTIIGILVSLGVSWQYKEINPTLVVHILLLGQDTVSFSFAEIFD